MNEENYFALTLLRLFANQPRGLGALLERFEGSAAQAFNHASRQDLAAAGLPGTSLRPGWQIKRQVKADLEWLDGEGRHLVRVSDAAYPARLKETFDPPCFLFADGRLDLLAASKPTIAMVGARNASRYGLDQAEHIAETLAGQGVTVVSGLALGIDGAAHRGALKVAQEDGEGDTIAVLGTGCDLIYPARHERLAAAIRERGLLLSEFPLGTKPWPANFPRRNRVVTGLAAATLVVEARVKSGSLISARLALAEGRDVMAMPGLVTNPRSRGCHRLIRDGALLIESAADVLRELGIEAEDNSPVAELTQNQAAIIAALEHQPLSIDQLALQLQKPVNELLVALMELEVMGAVKMEAGLYQTSMPASASGSRLWRH